MRQTTLDGRHITGTLAKARNYTADCVHGFFKPCPTQNKLARACACRDACCAGAFGCA